MKKILNLQKMFLNIKKAFHIIVLVILSILLTLGISELFLRRIYKKRYIEPPWQTTSRYLIDDRLIYTLKPSWYSEWKTTEFTEKTTTNKFGFRNIHDNSREKPPNIYRIIITGDSFTFGHGLEDQDTYPVKLENLLNQNRKDGKRFEVINAGVPGYSPDQQYRQIVEKLIYFSPDLIMWNLIPSNSYDLIEATPALYGIKNKNKLEPFNAKFNWLYIQNYLFIHTPMWVKNTHIFDLLVNTLPEIKFLWRKPHLSNIEMVKWAEKKLLLEIESINKLGKEKGFIFAFIILPDRETFIKDRNSDRNLNILDNVLQKTQERSIFAYDLKSNLASNLALETEKEKSTSNYISKKVLEITSYDPENLFFREDKHPNKLGASVLADIIAKYLTKLL